MVYKIPAITYRNHIIEADCFFDPDIKRWHVGCIITCPKGHRSSTLSCPNRPFERDYSGAIKAAFHWGAAVVRSGEW